MPPTPITGSPMNAAIRSGPSSAIVSSSWVIRPSVVVPWKRVRDVEMDEVAGQRPEALAQRRDAGGRSARRRTTPW